MYEGDHAKTKSGFGRTVLSVIGLVVLVVALSWGLRTFVFQAYEIPSGSMEETIMPKDMVFSEKITYYSRDPQYMDIVTFIDPATLPENNTTTYEDGTVEVTVVPERTLIKRVIATAGQTVNLIDGQVYVDGEPLSEPYTDGKPSFPLSTMEGVDIEYPYTVPENCIWVMGDNRTNSQDSRYFGAVDIGTVSGKAVFTYWPLDRIGPLN